MKTPSTPSNQERIVVETVEILDVPVLSDDEQETVRTELVRREGASAMSYEPGVLAKTIWMKLFKTD